MRMAVFLLFFFFQAEDGIRDYKVTGVQTCALPILTKLTLSHSYQRVHRLTWQFGCRHILLQGNHTNLRTIAVCQSSYFKVGSVTDYRDNLTGSSCNVPELLFKRS